MSWQEEPNTNHEKVTARVRLRPHHADPAVQNAEHTVKLVKRKSANAQQMQRKPLVSLVKQLHLGIARAAAKVRQSCVLLLAFSAHLGSYRI